MGDGCFFFKAKLESRNNEVAEVWQTSSFHFHPIPFAIDSIKNCIFPPRIFFLLPPAKNTTPFPEAVCVLQLEGGGSLRFVDLAGSERNYETRQMTAQQHRDFAEINKSLMALKVGVVDGVLYGGLGMLGMEDWGCLRWKYCMMPFS